MTDTSIIDEPKNDTGSASSETSAKLADTLKDNATRYSAQAADKAREFADTGKARATGALDQLSQMIHDAAAQVDERLGAQYGGYARTAADQVSGFADQLKAKDVDTLVDDVRDYVRKSPAVAIGIAAALGFVVARLVQSGIDSDSVQD